jgi:hypothetical protein
MQNALSYKRDSDQYQLHNTRLQDEVNLLKRDKDHATSHISTLQKRVSVCCSCNNDNKEDVRQMIVVDLVDG